MESTNKLLIKKLFEILVNQKQTDRVTEFYHDKFNDNNLSPGQPSGPLGIKMAVERYLEAFPDLHITLDAIVAEGNKVTTYETWQGTHKGWMDGFIPSNKTFKANRMHLFIIEDFKVVEEWSVGNVLEQLEILINNN